LYNLVLWTGPDIDVNDLKNYWKDGQEGLQQRHYNTSWYNNPHFQANEYLRGYYRDNIFGQLKLDYNVIPGLDLTLRTGINQYTLNRTWKEPKSYVAYDYVSQGNFALSGDNELNLNTDFIAQYVKELGENFTIRASAGGANRWRTFRGQYQSTDGLVVPEFYNLSNSMNPLRGRNSHEEQKVNRKERLGLDLTGAEQFFLLPLRLPVWCCLRLHGSLHRQDIIPQTKGFMVPRFGWTDHGARQCLSLLPLPAHSGV
jgi:hypothetical protein